MSINGSFASTISGTFDPTNLPNGSVIQVVTATYNTVGVFSTNTSGSPVSTSGVGLFSQAFTPKRGTSKIVVQTTQVAIHEQSNTANNAWIGAWYGSPSPTQIGINSGTISYLCQVGALNQGYYSLNHTCNSWGAGTTYNIIVRAGMDGSGFYVNHGDYDQPSSAYAIIGLTIMEIAG